MVKLYCAIAGEEGSAFPVDIDVSQSVGDLKKAIKAELTNTIKCDADELQLFLAEKDGAWLTENEVKEGVSDTSGLKPLAFARPELSVVGLSEDDVWVLVDKKEVAAGHGPVNVLVEVPLRDDLGSSAMALLEVMLPHVLTQAPTTLTELNTDFKENLCCYYGCYRRGKSWVRCMLLDVAFPKSLVIASHLFRRSNEYLSLVMMQIADIDDEKNGLLLFKPLKHAFDSFQLSFIRDGEDAFRLKLFDPRIRDTRLIDLTNREGGRVLSDEQIGVLHDSVSLTDNGCDFKEETTFGDVDGRTLVFTGLERPFYRCLSLQARVARMLALEKGWINGSYDFKDFWSEVALDDKMEMFHRSILNANAATF